MSLAENFQKVVSTAKLTNASLFQCGSAIHVPVESIDPSKTVIDQQRDVQWSVDKPGLLNCHVTTIVHAKRADTDDQDQALFEIMVCYYLRYEFTEQDLDEKAIELFAKTNAPYNAYPYLRAMAQDLSVRMGLKPITLPLLKPGTRWETFVPKKTKDNKKEKSGVEKPNSKVCAE